MCLFFFFGEDLHFEFRLYFCIVLGLPKFLGLEWGFGEYTTALIQ